MILCHRKIVCSYATRDLSGEPLTPWPGGTVPGNVWYNYNTSKVRIEEPVTMPGEVKEYNINPIGKILAKVTPGITQVYGYTVPSSSSFGYSFIGYSNDGNKLFQSSDVRLRYAGDTYKVFADSGGNGRDYINARLTYNKRHARVVANLSPLRNCIETTEIGPPGSPPSSCNIFGHEFVFLTPEDLGNFRMDFSSLCYIGHGLWIGDYRVRFNYAYFNADSYGLNFEISADFCVTSGFSCYYFIFYNLDGTCPVNNINISGRIEYDVISAYNAVKKLLLQDGTQHFVIFTPDLKFNLKNLNIDVEHVDFLGIPGDGPYTLTDDMIKFFILVELLKTENVQNLSETIMNSFTILFEEPLVSEFLPTRIIYKDNQNNTNEIVTGGFLEPSWNCSYYIQYPYKAHYATISLLPLLFNTRLDVIGFMGSSNGENIIYEFDFIDCLGWSDLNTYPP